jgi:hypothetical protein
MKSSYTGSSNILCPSLENSFATVMPQSVKEAINKDHTLI